MTPGRTPWRLLVALGLFSLAVRALAALPLRDAGYFDAFYYYHVAQNMAAGRGMVEDMIWNYLDQSPAAMQIPRPSHLYWMPLTTWIAWAGIRLFGRAVGEFRGALVPFVLLSALLPPLSGWIAWQLWRRRDFVLAAALLTLFSGFYFLYWVVPDNYTPFALAVALSLLGCWLGGQGHRSGWLLAGLGAGLSHLSRADGILLVPTIALLITRTRPTTPAAPPTIPISHLLPAALLAAAGYVAVVAPWLLRNVAVAGTPLPGGGLKTLWMRSYDELFSYQLSLTPEYLIEWGIGPVVRSKLQTLVWNGVIVLGALQFFLAPFAWLGLRRARNDESSRALLRPVLLYATLLFLAMTLLFTFPSRRGSLLHSAAALIPWLMALVPAGIEAAAARFASWRGHAPEPAVRFFGAGFVALAAIVSLWLYSQALFLPPAPNATLARWNDRSAHYRAAEEQLEARAATGPALVLSPPTYTVATGRPSLAIPSDSLDAITAVADRFGARWLIVEQDHAAPLAEAWRQGVPPPGWRHVADVEDAVDAPVRIFERE